MKRKCDNLRTLCDRAMTKRTTSALIQHPQHDSEEHIEQNIGAASKNPEMLSSLTFSPVPLDEQTERVADEQTEPNADEGTKTEEDEAIYDIDWLEHDPGRRIPITDYDVNERDRVRRRYVALGPCQPRQHDFPRRDIGGMCRFIVGWYGAYPWLEYSVEKDAAFYFVCYLFKDKFNCACGDSFLRGGFKNWNQIYKFQKHVASIDSYHCETQEKYDLFMRPNASVVECIASTSTTKMACYISRLTYSLKCLRFLLHQGSAFRGHNERKDSLNRGNFLELLNWLAQGFEEVNKVVLVNSPGNNQMASPQIQKDLIGCCAKETTSLLIQDLGDDYFAILADESSDVYQQEQMALCLRYVDKKGSVVERFLGIVHVEDTTALTLKTAIGSLLKDQGLSFSMVRGQGYDGASNMMELVT